MRNPVIKKCGKGGFVSYVMVLSTGAMLSLLMIFAYRNAVQSQSVQSVVNLQIDYAEKEDNLLRSVIAITPNRAIRAMRGGSDVAGVRETLTWQRILTDALVTANAGQALDAGTMNGLGLEGIVRANPGDSTMNGTRSIFGVPGTTPWVRAGANINLGTGYPPALNASTQVATNDRVYPIISRDKKYGSYASGRVGLPVASFPEWNLVSYPQINFGYANPGAPFVAKRNWWTFNLNLSANDAGATRVIRPSREFVLSIYEVPSQLAISASAFASLGTHSTGDAWQNINVEGNVFASRAEVTGDTVLSGLSSRRGMELSETASIGGQSFEGSPFMPGVRESYEVASEGGGASPDGSFFPLSLPSESGRAAFIPINRGAEFFDRYQAVSETNTLSPTSWNQYSIGALQCAMQLDIQECVSASNPTPTVLKFSYLRNGNRITTLIPQVTGILGTLPDGYVKVADENQTYDFGSQRVDVAYGLNGRFYFQTGVTGVVQFTNARFGDPIVGTFKAGYWRPSAPFAVRTINNKVCIGVYPQRFPEFLSRIGADGPAVNHSVAVNVNHVDSLRLRRPAIPPSDLDYGVILEECADFRAFSKGFSLVTNLRLYIGDDFNVVPGTAPNGYVGVGPYYPPCSLFAPEKRYGVESDPYALQLAGQLGSLADENNEAPVHLMDSIGMSGVPIHASRIRATLSQIRHPADLPPITMMNWLVVLEEKRREFGGE